MIRSLACLVLLTAVAAAQDPVAPVVRAHATRRASSVTVDGHLDEAAWSTAPRQSGFIQRFPKDGVKADHETSFAVLYDDEALYIGVWADDPEPHRVRRNLIRRDVDSVTDAVAIAIDSYHDKRTAFMFQLNAAGVQRDTLLFDDSGADDTWDAVWTGDSALTATGWTAEFRIPLNQLRFSSGDTHEWGLQVVRLVARTNEQSTWSPWPRSGPQIVSKFGIVDGIDHVKPSRRLELLPYGLAGVGLMPVASGDPLNDHVDMRRNIGLDIKYGLGPAFTLSATINPDFGQVEADPSQVNLSANELFFAEKRPFFLEGVDLFKLPIGNSDNSVEGAFYSRRIGAAPEAPDGDFVSSPQATTIYGAAKLTGKEHGWSIGLLDAVTGKETADVETAGMHAEPVVAPLTNFAVARVKRDLREGKTSIGMSATAVNRALSGTALADTRHDQAYTTGLQIQHRWASDAWQLNFSTLGSYVHGTPAAIFETQTANRHLYQRPDKTDATLDPARTSLSGLGATWLVGRVGETKHWRFGSGGDLRTPGLELNDAGFQVSSDRIIPFVWGEYHDNTPGKNILNWQVNSDVFFGSTFEPTVELYGLEDNVSVQFANYWQAGAGSNLVRGRWDSVALRGGPSLRSDPGFSTFGWINTDTRKRVWVSLNANAFDNWTSGTVAWGLSAGVQIQARDNIDINIAPGYSERDDALQYVTQVDDHFVLARIREREIATTLRVNWTFSPHLSLQAYAQPFLASGRYSEFKDVDNPHAVQYHDRFHLLGANEYSVSDEGVVHVNYKGMYDFDKPDFSFGQLRSTLVLRWEYRPGSSVFAIWSHGQTNDSSDGRLRIQSDLHDLARADSEDIVMVKANYWIGL
jgi:hypothetical protein